MLEDTDTGRRIDGKPYHPKLSSVKTTIDIPEPLYKQVKIRAVERNLTLKQIVLDALQRELELSLPSSGVESASWKRRRLLPEFETAMKAGAFRPAPNARDVTHLISEDRDAR